MGLCYRKGMALPPIEIEADIRRARTLPSAVYFERAWWYRQRERLFPRSWHMWPGATSPDGAGALTPWNYLEGCLSEPLLLACGEDARVRCMSNVCTHRGNVLVDRPCQVQGIRCRYHGRRFDLQGRMISMPEFEQAEDFGGPEENLPFVEMVDWHGMRFASLDPREDLQKILRPVEDRIGFLPLDAAQVDAEGVSTYEFEGNWALYCDNFLEGFHIPYVHPGLRGALDYSAYETETFAGGVLQVGVGSEDEHCFELPADHPDAGRRIAAYYYWLFPCTMLNVYPWGISVNVVLPQGPTRTRVVFIPRVWDHGKRGRGAGSGLDQVEMEDEEVVLAVQRGVKSRLYDRGRYSPTRERGVHHFHRMMAEWLSD